MVVGLRSVAEWSKSVRVDVGGTVMQIDAGEECRVESWTNSRAS